MTTRVTTLLRAVLYVAVAGLIACAVLSMTTGCATAPREPTPEPRPTPTVIQVPVFVPCPPPPPLPPVHWRLDELPAEARLSDEEIAQRAGTDPDVVRRIREAILYALRLDRDDCKAALAQRDAVLDVLRQQAGVPMTTTASPLPTPTP